MPPSWRPRDARFQGGRGRRFGRRNPGVHHGGHGNNDMRDAPATRKLFEAFFEESKRLEEEALDRHLGRIKVPTECGWGKGAPNVDPSRDLETPAQAAARVEFAQKEEKAKLWQNARDVGVVASEPKPPSRPRRYFDSIPTNEVSDTSFLPESTSNAEAELAEKRNEEKNVSLLENLHLEPLKDPIRDQDDFVPINEHDPEDDVPEHLKRRRLLLESHRSRPDFTTLLAGKGGIKEINTQLQERERSKETEPATAEEAPMDDQMAVEEVETMTLEQHILNMHRYRINRLGTTSPKSRWALLESGLFDDFHADIFLPSRRIPTDSKDMGDLLAFIRLLVEGGSRWREENAKLKQMIELPKAFGDYRKQIERISKQLKEISLTTEDRLAAICPVLFDWSGSRSNTERQRMVRHSDDLLVILKEFRDDKSISESMKKEKEVVVCGIIEDPDAREPNCRRPVEGYNVTRYWTLGGKKVHFCSDHTMAVLTKRFCPVCRMVQKRTEKTDETVETERLCRGPRGTDPAHFFHIDCVMKQGSPRCPHCNSTNSSDWKDPSDRQLQRSMPFSLSSEKMRRALTNRTPFNAEKNFTPLNMDKTVPIRGSQLTLKSLPLTVMDAKKLAQFGGPKYPSAFVEDLVRKQVSDEDEYGAAYQSRYVKEPQLRSSRYNLPLHGQVEADASRDDSKLTVFEKYHRSFIDLCAETTSCICKGACISGICPCMKWTAKDSYYQSDGKLVMGFDWKDKIITECTEACGCNVRRCTNRVTQMPSKVLQLEQFANGKVPQVTRRVRKGEFICKLPGKLNECVAPRNYDSAKLPAKFLLPKLPFWADSPNTDYYLSIENTPLNFELVQDMEQATVVPVMVLDAPFNCSMGFPRHLAPMSIAFFAAEDFGPSPSGNRKENVFKYPGDFRDVVLEVPTMDLQAGKPVQPQGDVIFYSAGAFGQEPDFDGGCDENVAPSR